MTDQVLTPEEYAALMAIAENLDVIGAVFHGGELSMPALRMAIASFRAAADALEGAANRWEAAA